MTLLLRSAFLCALAATAAAFIFWATGGGWDEGARRGRRLDADAEALDPVLATKHKALAELVAERISLAEAARRFQAVDARLPPYLRACGHGGPGETLEANYARNVLAWVRAYVRSRPEKQAVLDRISAELRESLGGLAE